MKTRNLSTYCIRRSLGRCALLFIPLLIVCFTFLPNAQAVSPAPDGGYPGDNTAEGQNALLSLTTGGFNTAIGWSSLRSDTSNSFNTAIGAGALFANTADENTAIGAAALLSNSTGTFNTASGVFALFSNTTGGDNTATGSGALGVNSGGNDNTATGFVALQSNTTGNGNTAIGMNALGSNTTGSGNIALGENSGVNVTTANNAICIGTGGNNIDNSCYIGNIFGANVGMSGMAVFVNSNGRLGTATLGTATSSRRFKEEIRPMERASEAILALRPVSFRCKKEIDPQGIPQFGLVAEDVEKVNADLVVRDKEGKPYSVRYDQVNAMLLNEFLKEHRKVEQLTRDFESKIARQQKQIEALTAGLQKVSAQLAAASPSRGGLEASKFATGRIRRGGPALQTVLNNR